MNAGVHARARGADVSFRYVKIKIPDRGMWMTSCTGNTRRILGDLKKSVRSWFLRSEEEGLTFACSSEPVQWPCGGCHTWWGGADGKVIIERLCISLPYVETFNSKVIKGFVPELRSRYVFFVFRDSYVLCIYVMNILCTFRKSVSGYGTFELTTTLHSCPLLLHPWNSLNSV